MRVNARLEGEIGASLQRAVERYGADFVTLWLSADPVADFAGAASAYRAYRAGGITPRGLIDYMIASIAIRTGARFLAADRDVADMARILPLQLV